MGTIDAARNPIGCLSLVEREGLAWVELMNSGDVTTGDLVALERWRSQSLAHADAFVAALKLRRLVGVRQTAREDRYVLPVMQRPATRRAMFGGAMAAAATTYAVIQPPLGLWPSLAELSSDYRTGTGERRDLALARGLSMTMNTRTSVAMRSKPGQPGLELIAGEIIVAANLAGSQEFAIFTGGSRLSIRRGKFDLRNDESGICATCLDGAGEIAHRGGRLRLLPRQQVALSNAVLSAPVVADPDLVTAWRHGLLIFHNEPLRNVVAEINRYRPGKILIANTELAARRFSGDFRIDRIEDVVTQIKKVSGASTSSLPGGIILLS
jgi:transmembrane sensor